MLVWYHSSKARNLCCFCQMWSIKLAKFVKCLKICQILHPQKRGRKKRQAQQDRKEAVLNCCHPQTHGSKHVVINGHFRNVKGNLLCHFWEAREVYSYTPRPVNVWSFISYHTSFCRERNQCTSADLCFGVIQETANIVNVRRKEAT